MSNKHDKLFKLIHESEMNTWVGDSSASEAGRGSARLVDNLGHPKAGDTLLDFGCGVGRVMVGLDELLSDVKLIGVDIVPSMVDFCKINLQPEMQNTSFYCTDATNPCYEKHMDGSLAGESEEKVFSELAGDIDLLFAFSVFTHLAQKEAEFYFRELRKLVSNSGKILISAYLLDPFSRGSLINKRIQANQDFWEGCRGDEDVYVSDEELLLVAYDSNLFIEMLRQAGFQVQQINYGYWRGIPQLNNSGSLQDVIVATPMSFLPDDFHEAAYLALNPDVAASGVDAQEHYLNCGYYEKRLYSALGKRGLPDGFNPEDYLIHNPDVKSSGMDAATHYMLYGEKEKRRYN